VVAYIGTYEKDGNIWIVMEYCGAGSLCDLMAICERTLDEEQIAVCLLSSLLFTFFLRWVWCGVVCGVVCGGCVAFVSVLLMG